MSCLLYNKRNPYAIAIHIAMSETVALCANCRSRFIVSLRGRCAATLEANYEQPRTLHNMYPPHPPRQPKPQFPERFQSVRLYRKVENSKI